jgi:hypothetical protein
MKTRNGFVSNSSSASFILALLDEPHSFESARKLIFGETPGIKTYYDVNTGRGQFKGTIFELTGFLYGQILKSDSEYNPNDPIDMFKLMWFNAFDKKADDKLTKLHDAYCDKYIIDGTGKARSHCKKECPVYNNCQDQLYINDRSKRKIEWSDDLKRLEKTIEITKKFVAKTPGYKYYYIDCGCQTVIGEFLQTNCKEVFKHINYVSLGDL